MVVEELVAKLGFKVDGLGELKKFEGGLKRMAKGVSDFGTALNRSLSNVKLGALNGVGAIGSKMAQGFKSAASSIAIAAAGAARMAAGVAAVSATLVGAVALAAKLAYNFVKARGEAAKLRQEAQLEAKGQKTTAGGVDSLAKGLRAIGAKPDEAKSLVSAMASKVEDAIQKRDYSEFQKAGIKPLEKDGRRRDTAAVVMEGLAKYADMKKQADAYRAKEDAANKAGRKGEAGAAAKKANDLEIKIGALGQFLGITEQTAGALEKLQGGAKELYQRFEEAARVNPGLTKEEEDRKTQLATQWQRLSDKFEGITSAVERVFGNMADIVSLKIIPALDALADTLLSWGKRLGIISETQGEREDKAKAKAAAAVDPKGVAEARKAAGDVQGDFSAWIFGLDDSTRALAALSEAARNYDQAKSERERTAGEVSPDRARDIEKNFQDMAARLVEAFKHLQDIQRQNTPDGAAKKSNEKTEKKVIHDNRSDMGNDHRVNNVTVNQTVNGFAEGAQKAAAAVLGAVSAKASVSMTAASAAP